MPEAARRTSLERKQHARATKRWVDRLDRLVRSGDPEWAPGVITSTYKGPKEWLTDKRKRGAFERELERALGSTPHVIKYELDADGMGAHAHVTAAQTREAWNLLSAAERLEEYTWAMVESELHGWHAPEVKHRPQWGGRIDQKDIGRWGSYMAKATYEGGLPSTKDVRSKYSQDKDEGKHSAHLSPRWGQLP
ncbi:hypothetical protein DNA98_09975 [Meiothermus sp. Pnk-1]|nr:hypothetical protein DNA98_09975 [Meiothermus sp. Pnk-1]